MPRFFIENVSGEFITVSGQDAAHIAKSLRMKPGESVTVCGGQGIDFLCEITELSEQTVQLRVVDTVVTQSEPSLRVTLYQGLPKGDKLEWIIEKTIELGVSRIVPVLMQRSVSRPDAKSAAKKHERYNKLALSAAKQCGRGMIPEVAPMCSFRETLPLLNAHDLVIFFYECGGQPLSDAVADINRAAWKDIAIVIGPEGGFDPAEAEALQAAGAFTATLGPRILRTETAPLAALSALMYGTGNW
ncbi:MAG: 16S rRNA (uracil(1498)-N(3))-methyltransferase [Clostridia bacterium]|nr:16S rRNA (uracil(1498)-N(3))-methyltransferase [Clostridia bacterium]